MLKYLNNLLYIVECELERRNHVPTFSVDAKEFQIIHYQITQANMFVNILCISEDLCTIQHMV